MWFWQLAAKRLLLATPNRKVLMAKANYDGQFVVEMAGLW